MRNETADRDPRLKQTVLTWDFPTRVTVSTNDSTFITEESKFIDQYCYTGYKSIKYFIPTDKALRRITIGTTESLTVMLKLC